MRRMAAIVSLMVFVIKVWIFSLVIVGWINLIFGVESMFLFAIAYFCMAVAVTIMSR